jgi:hypothetical protein
VPLTSNLFNATYGPSRRGGGVLSRSDEMSVLTVTPEFVQGLILFSNYGTD